MRELLRLRDFRRLLAGQAVSSFGDWMGTLALMYFVLQLSGSATAVGGVLVLRLLPSAVGAPLAARAVTRWNRRRVMMSADLLRAGMAVLLPLIPWLGWVFIWAFLMEVVSLAFLPARDSSVPVLIGDEHEATNKQGPQEDGAGNEERHETGRLALANGLVLGTYYSMVPLGAGTFGLLHLISDSTNWTGHLEYVVVFWVDALSYVVSFLAIRSLPDLGPYHGVRRTEQAVRAETAGQIGFSGAADPGGSAEAAGRDVPDPESAEERLGLLAALRIPFVRQVLLAVGIVSLGLGALFSIGVVFVQDVLHAGPLGFGALVALFGIGFVLGLGVLRRREGNLPALVRAGVAGQGLVIMAMGLFPHLAPAFGAAVLFGVAATTALVSAITYLQDGLSGNVRNVALTAFHGTLRFGLAVSALAAGAAADLLKGTVTSLGPFGTLQPVQVVLIASGLVAFLGSFLVGSG